MLKVVQQQAQNKAIATSSAALLTPNSSQAAAMAVAAAAAAAAASQAGGLLPVSMSGAGADLASFPTSYGNLGPGVSLAAPAVSMMAPMPVAPMPRMGKL